MPGSASQRVLGSAQRAEDSAEEEGGYEDTAKADQARDGRETKACVPPKRKQKAVQGSQHPKRPPAFFFFWSEYRPKIKGEHPTLSIGDIAKKLGDAE